MKRLENIYILVILLAFSFFVGACDNEYEPAGFVSDVSWYTSQRNGTDYQLNEDEYMAFMDLSQGLLSHEWIIEEGAYFLKDGFSKNDSLPLFIDETKGLSSDDAAVSILFTKPGERKVRLYNTFSEKVSYKGAVEFEAIQEGDIWVIDTTFIVDVYGAMKPAFQVFQLVEDEDGNIIEEKEILSVDEEWDPQLEDAAEWDTIEVEMGSRLKYVDLTTTDRPTGRTWTFFNKPNEVSNLAESIVYYNKLGDTNNGAGTLRSERTSENNSVPSANTLKRIPLHVRTVASSKPFVFIGGLMEHEDESITFSVSGTVAKFSGIESAFTVNVTNDKTGFDEVIAVQLAEVNPEDPTSIKLTLADPIYNTDKIKVSYDPAKGEIKSSDERSLSLFTNEDVLIYAGENILDSDWAGFEIYKSNIRSAYCDGYWAAAINDNGTYQRTETMSLSGIACMRYSSTDGFTTNRTLQGSDFSKGGDIPAGTFLVTLNIYLESGNTMTKIKTAIQTPYQAIPWDLTDVERGKWVTLSQEITTDLIVSGKRYDLLVNPADNPTAVGDQTFYIDDHSFTNLELRP